MNCRHCQNGLAQVFIDLDFAPPSNAYLTADDLRKPEVYFPLKIYICNHCWLAQTEDYAQAQELFRADYAYFSSVSQSWLDHAARYTSMISERLDLTPDSLVIEVAANDGYLLKNFVATGIPCLGIEPTASTADAAEAESIPVVRDFFGESLARRLKEEGRQADLIIGNNVYAHVPDINDFTLGLKIALKPGGTITLEFPHLLRLIKGMQFDTVYHEHYSYLSLYTVKRIFEKVGLRILDVEELSTHGGSLRIYGCHAEDSRQAMPVVDELLALEDSEGLRNSATYKTFQPRVEQIKNDLLVFLIEQKKAGKIVAAYGAAAKGNTLFNYAGIKADLLPFICDASPFKQGKFLPGSHIPIMPPAMLLERKPDYVLIPPWNIAEEIMEQNSAVREQGTNFVIAVPSLQVFS